MILEGHSMRVLTTLALTLFLLTACNLTDNNAPNNAPTSPPGLTGSVDIAYPIDGTTVYAEALLMRGTASGLPNNTFTLEIVGVDDEIIARSSVTMTDGQWMVELPHSYTGEPIEVSIYAIPSDPDLTSDLRYDTGTIILAGLSYRPEGIFGTVTFPTADSTVSGETIPVSGTASGLFEGTMLLGLYSEDGTEISRLVLTLEGQPYDVVPWTAELPTNGYIGLAEIRAFYQQASDGKPVILSSAIVTVSATAG
jgi:hypothetical protein